MTSTEGQRWPVSLWIVIVTLLLMPPNGWQVSAVSRRAINACMQEVNCKRPSCVCPSSKPPIGIKPRDVPQFVYFTFDDAVTHFTSRAFDVLFPPERTNPNGCPITMTLFISHFSTDYDLVHSYYQRGMELAVHSVNHKHIRSADAMLYEAVQQRKNIAKEARVPIDKITGWRSPFLLPYGNKQFEILQQNGFEYDSTLTIDRGGLEGKTYWPMTLDHGWPFACMVIPCPKSNFSSFWEVPIISVMDYQKSFPCQYIDGCVQPPPDEEAAFQYLWQNFQSYYKKDRAPFGINMHAAWFAWPERLAGMNKFVQELVKLDDVYIVNVQQLIEYMKNPVKLSEIVSYKPFQCKRSGSGIVVPASQTRPKIPQTTSRTTRYTTSRVPLTTRRRQIRTTTPRPITRKRTTRRIVTTSERFSPVTRRTLTTRRTTLRRARVRQTTPTHTTRRTTPTTRQNSNRSTPPWTTKRTTTPTTTRRTTTKSTTTRRTTTRRTTSKPTTTRRPTTTTITKTTNRPTRRSTASDDWRYKTATPWWNLVHDPVTGQPWWKRTVTPSRSTSHPWWDSRRRTPYHRPTPAPTKPVIRRRTTTRRMGRRTTAIPTPVYRWSTTTRRYRLKLTELIPKRPDDSWKYWTRHSVVWPTAKPTVHSIVTLSPERNRQISQGGALDPSKISKADGRSRCLQGVNCILPNCFCDGKQVPRTVSANQMPQIVYVTFEGPITPQIYVEFVRLFSSRRRNPNGCPIKATFFIPSSSTDPGYTRTLYERGNEISLLAHRGDPMRQRDLLAVRTEIPKSDIKGWRSENLTPLSEGYYNSLPKYGFKYDSSLIDTRERKGNQLWPLTLDYGWTRQCNIKPCPTEPHPGLWEIPVVASYDVKGMYPCTYMDGCHMQPQSTNDTFKLLWDNFQSFYTTNRAPFAINLQQTWFHYFYLFKLEALNEFIERLVGMEDVYIVTISEMLDWIKDPVPLNELTNFHNWQCF